DFTLMSSYHCSRYNTNTGRLTTEMFEGVFKTVRERLVK
ncbi:MAG: uracil-DNA glycosylase, partial [Alphaproteobacteria bacterium]|nr:uracil-DNA glycosylase [Alphaproteobacteria bacterium]